MGIKDGTYIRVSGTSRPAGRDLTAEMYYEDEGRSYDTVIRKDLTVTDEEIAELCRQMKEVAVSNAKSKAQAEGIKNVTKNVLLREYSGPLWKQIDDAFQFVLRNIRLGARLEGIYWKDIYELPRDSIRELIINAVMRRRLQ